MYMKGLYVCMYVSINVHERFIYMYVHARFTYMYILMYMKDLRICIHWCT